MRISVHHNLEDLEADFRTIARRAPGEFRGVVRDGLRAGNMLAKDFARQSERAHAKYYHAAFTTDLYAMGRFSGGVNSHAGEYGPVAIGQGNLAPILEGGSRNNPPHNDLAKSADIIGPAFVRSVRDVLDDLFWPRS